MIPLADRPAGYLLTLEDLTEAVFWARSQSGQMNQAMVPFAIMKQFGIGEMKDGFMELTPLHYEWIKGLGDAVFSVDEESNWLLIEWWGE